LNATKITAGTGKDAKSPTSVVNRETSLSPTSQQQQQDIEFNSDYEDDEIIEFEDSMLSELVNQHEAAAIVETDKK
jgi:hypothetical protein